MIISESKVYLHKVMKNSLEIDFILNQRQNIAQVLKLLAKIDANRQPKAKQHRCPCLGQQVHEGRQERADVVPPRGSEEKTSFRKHHAGQLTYDRTIVDLNGCPKFRHPSQRD